MKKTFRKVLSLMLPIALVVTFIAFKNGYETFQASANDKEAFLVEKKLNVRFTHVEAPDDANKRMVHLVWPRLKNDDDKLYAIERSIDDSPWVEMASTETDNLVEVASIPAAEYSPYNNILFTHEIEDAFIYNEVFDGEEFFESNIKYRVRIEKTSGQITYSGYVSAKKVNSTDVFQRVSAACPTVDKIPSGYTQDASSVKTVTCDCGSYSTANYMPPCVEDPSQIKCDPAGGNTYDCSAKCNCTYDKCCQHSCTDYSKCGCPGSWPACMGGYTPINLIFSVSPYTAPKITLKATNCTGACNGSIDATSIKAGSSGSTKFTYSWSPSGSGSVASGLCNGSYTVTVTDEFGCVSTASASITGCLPIKLLKFSAEKRDRVALLQWTSASETDNDYYTIEKSNDGQNYTPLKIVKGAGNSSTLKHYSEIDNMPYLGNNYYRLKQTDFDGKFEYVGIQALEFDQTELFTISPNPTKGNVNMLFFANEENVKIAIFNFEGKQVYEKNYGVVSGLFRLDKDMSSMSNGVYHVVLTTKSGVLVKKLIKY